MIETRRRAYLDAMGFDLWSIKPPEPDLDRLLIQPGEGSTLLICETPDATATRFAGDVTRALAGDVVWGWPDPSASPENPSLKQAVGQFLFTRVVMFGTGLERRFFKNGAAPVVGSASITVCESLDELAVRGSAKRIFWRHLRGKLAN